MSGVDYDRVAKNLAAIGDITAKLGAEGLSREAIAVLIKHKTRIPMTTINTVIDQLGQLSLWAMAKKKP
jgi:hypothetical protein